MYDIFIFLYLTTTAVNSLFKIYELLHHVKVFRVGQYRGHLCVRVGSAVLLLLSVGLPVANAPDVLQPCGLLYYP